MIAGFCNTAKSILLGMQAQWSSFVRCDVTNNINQACKLTATTLTH